MLRLEGGEELEATIGKPPFEFTYGDDRIIAGLEKELLGLESGDRKSITVIAAEGYEERQAEAIREIEKGEFPEGVNPEVGSAYLCAEQGGEGCSELRHHRY